VSLPSGVFKPYSGVGTAVLVFQKGGPTESVWFYDLQADGFSLDDKRLPIEANDVPDLLALWPERGDGPNSFQVRVDRIRENGVNLTPGRYRDVPNDATAHEDPRDILADVLRLEEEISGRAQLLLKELRQP
jgi:type I restriction enzyme M protein